MTIALFTVSMKYKLEFPGFSLLKILGISVAAAITGMMFGGFFGFIGIVAFTSPPDRIVGNPVAVLDLFAHFGCLISSWYFSMWAFEKYSDVWIKGYANQQ
jgi:hypothetical protein